ncbi:hypothetical protein [Hyphomicrobium sp.]|uniref:hypothetical protein n=1 Tax=Hyphomicrobium sp. TaxID=82 RepID=UPI001DE7B06F|nr:hypothetical protein [Hyphomicrobium sp.]MBY0560060.1 hypothetical protein [Hyphomicrobium sp.]
MKREFILQTEMTGEGAHRAMAFEWTEYRGSPYLSLLECWESPCPKTSLNKLRRELKKTYGDYSLKRAA